MNTDQQQWDEKYDLGTSFTPIINAPEVAILGVTKVAEEPVRGAQGEIEWRQMLPLSLSYDHHSINGADAARFLRRMDQLLSAVDTHFFTSV